MSGILPHETFDFVVSNELKRAARSQNFVTLLVLEAAGAQAPGLAGEIAAVIGRELRATDLLAIDGDTVSVALLDTDLQGSSHVIDRLMTQIEHYRFSAPVNISIGAACCPTHGSDAKTLWRTAFAQRQRPPRRVPES